MIIDCKMFPKACACGQTHSISTQSAVIEAGCLKSFDDHLAVTGLPGHRAAIYDTNTYDAKGLHRPVANQEIILPAEGLIADDGAVASVLDQLSGNTEILIAVGSGTLHDIVRYCANKLGLPFVSCPTAASTDGYATNCSTMTFRGMQVIVPATAPALILADLDVIAKAPQQMARAGVGEALGKFTSVADWKIASLLTGKPACTALESMLRQAAVAALGSCEDLQRGDERAFAQLMYALLLSGFAVQAHGTSAPAYGAEHMLSSLMDLLPAYGDTEGVLHGEQVGICAITIADLYHRMAAIDDIAAYTKPFKPLDAETLAKHFGQTLAYRLLDENTPDCLQQINTDTLVRHWQEIQRIILETPSQETLTQALASIGAKTKTEELGLSGAQLPRMLQLSPVLCNRLTLTRLMRMLKFRYASKSESSRAPSRKSRYADKAITRAGSSKAVSASSMR